MCDWNTRKLFNGWYQIESCVRHNTKHMQWTRFISLNANSRQSKRIQIEILAEKSDM